MIMHIAHILQYATLLSLLMGGLGLVVAVVNHREGVERITRAATTVLGAEHVDPMTEPEGWAEDFAYYLQHRPGAFYLLGSGNAEKGITASLHSSHYDFDETALTLGAAVMATIVLQGR